MVTDAGESDRTPKGALMIATAIEGPDSIPSLIGRCLENRIITGIDLKCHKKGHWASSCPLNTNPRVNAIATQDEEPLSGENDQEQQGEGMNGLEEEADSADQRSVADGWDTALGCNGIRAERH